MGVTGLWRLIEPAGKPVPVETLENKVLAVDISIWLHQMVKGYQDAKGAPLANAHLMGLFQRLCKLLYFRIKPIFVFDGAYPDLKKETIAKRQDNKSKYNSESERLKRELALLLRKKTAVSTLLGKQISPKKASSTTSPGENDDLFKLPALPQREEESESESDDEQNSSGSIIDLHSVDIESDKFKSLPTKEKYDMLIELKETRKMNSWGKLHELPKKSDNFSDFQLKRLLKRRKVQECLQETEKEMGGAGMSLNDLESLLNEEGIDTKIEALPSRRIASNNTTRFLLINNVKQALADAKKRKEAENQPSTSKNKEQTPIVDEKDSPKSDELEDDLQKAIKMSLECVTEADNSGCTSKTDDSWTSCMTDTDYSNDSEEEDGFEQPDNISTAKAYIMQYSDYTDRAINKIVSSKNSNNKNKSKVPKINEILDEINREKSIIVDNVELSSSDEDCIQDKPTSKLNVIENVHSNTEELIVENVDLTSSTEDVIKAKPDNKVCEIENIDFNADKLIQASVDVMDITQSSVVCVGTPVQDIITLDSSTEETFNENENNKSTIDNSEESSSSNDEFEDVPDLETKTNKPIVELTLNMGEVPNDDIFADIFDDKKVSSKINEEKNVKIEALTLIQTKNIVTEDEQLDIPKIKESQSFYDDVQENDESQNNEQIDKRIEEITTINGNSINVESNAEPPKNNKQNDKLSTIIQEKIVEKDANKPPRVVMTTEKLNTLVKEMESEEQVLLQEKGRMDRVGRNITEQMTKEAQELLQIFGIPYIVAPMEAEAQCAFLESVNLTDGTITDDSDIWLFGGRTVYKNFFNQKKHVLQFLADRIEKSFNLNREQLVLLALLVGSDYTTGLTGVGPVTALEILASFPVSKKQLVNETTRHTQYTQILTGLHEFKRWVRSGKRTDNTTLKKKLRNVDLTDDFPSVRVVQAYLEPNVEKSEDKFTWGELDITILRDYAKEKFGWSQNKLDEIIKPVMKRMSERKNQKTVQDYFQKKVEFQSLEHQLSKRVKAAVQRMDPEKAHDEQNILGEEKTKVSRKRKVIKSKSDENAIDDSIKTPAKAGPSRVKQKKNNEESVLSDHCVKVVSQIDAREGKSIIDIKIPKTDRYQEFIPQREKQKQLMLQNKLKAIEIFRKTKIDPKKKISKRKALQPKKKAELSESDSD